MRLATKLLFTLLILLGTTSGRAVLPNDQDKNWERQNDKGNRYEGLIYIKTGNPDLEVLSFKGSMEEYGTKAVNLKVKFFHQTQDKLSIIAQEIETRKQYFMKAKQDNWQTGAWNEFGPWPTNEVINKENIPSDNLGILIRGGGTRLLPAFVYHSKLPPIVAAYTMHVRTNRNLKNVRLSLHGKSDKTQLNPRIWMLGAQMADIPFTINLDVRAFSEGEMRLVIERQLLNSKDKLPIHEYTFYHRPKIQ